MSDRLDEFIATLPGARPDPDAGEGSAFLARVLDPDRAARGLRLGRETGLPPEMVLDRLDDVEREFAHARVLAATRGPRRRPVLGRFLEHPPNAAVASDDLDALGGTEDALFAHRLEVFEQLRESLRRDQTPESELPTDAALREMAAAPDRPENRTLYGRWKALAASTLLGSLAVRGFLRLTGRSAETVRLAGEAAAAAVPQAESRPGELGQGALHTLLSVGTDLPFYEAGSFILPGFGTFALPRLVRGVEEGEGARSLASGTVRSGIVGALLPGGKALGGIAGKRLAGAAGGAIGRFTGEAGVFGLAAPVIEEGRRPTLDDMASAAATIAAFRGQDFAGRAISATAAKARGKFLRQTGAALAPSKLAGRDPATAAEFVQAAAEASGKPEQVLVPLAQWVTYWQSKGREPGEVAAELGQGAAYAESLSTGADVAIPFGRFMVDFGAKPEHAELLKDVRLAPLEMTEREAEAFEAEATKAEPAAAEAGKEPTPTIAPDQQVEDALAVKLTAAGFTPADSQRQAALWGGFFRAWASREGGDPADLARTFDLTISREQAPPSERPPRPRAPRKAMHAVDLTGTGDVLSWIRSSGGLAAADYSELTARNPVWKDLPLSVRRSAEKGGKRFEEFTGQLVEAGFFDSDTDARDWLMDALHNPQGVRLPDRGRRDLDQRDMALEEAKARGWERPPTPEEEAARAVEVAARNDEFERRMLAQDLAEAGLAGEADKGDRAAAIMGAQPEQARPEQLRDGETVYVPEDRALYRVTSDEDGRVTLDSGAIVRRLDESETVGVVRVEKPAGQEFSQADEADHRRGLTRVTLDGQTFEIRLTPHADLSTFLHETGHVFTVLLGKRASAEGAPESVRRDWQALREFAGAKEGEEITEAGHEKIARTFEEYLRTARAPSERLRSAFARFRVWLSAVYGRIKSVAGADLTPAVRGVFDRLLATDAEIEAVEGQARYRTLFDSAEQAGVTPEEFDSYQRKAAAATAEAKARLARKVIEEHERETRRWWAEEKSAEAERVSAELAADPLYRAAHLLREGAMLDGSEVPEALRGLKLNTDAVREMGGTDMTSRLSTMLSPEGMAPDEAAELLGFRSADEMLQGFVNMEPRSKLVPRLADERLRARFGDVLREGRLQEEAIAAVHTTDRAEVLLRELEFLARKASVTGPAPSRDRIKATAERIVRGKVIGRLNPHAYRAAEVGAARAAGEAVGRGDWIGAHTQKQRQLLSFFAYNAARKVKIEEPKAARLLRRMTKPPAQKRLGLAGGGFQETMNRLLARFGVGPTPAVPGPELRSWVQDRIEAGDDVTVSEWLMDEQRSAPLGRLTVAEFFDVRDAVRNISHLGTEANKVISEGLRVDKANAVAELGVAAEKNLSDKGLPAGDRTILPFTERVGWLRGVWADFVRMETHVRQLDGGRIDGPWHRFLWNVYQDAKARELDLNKLYSEKVAAAVDAMPDGVRRRLSERIHLPGLGAATGTSGDERSRRWMLGVLLNMGNPEGLQRLQAGNRLTAEHLTAITGKATAEELAFVQGVLDAVGGLFPEIAALHRRRTGVDLKKVEAVPILTPAGTIPGGYFPLVYDRRMSSVGERQSDAALGQLFDQRAPRAYTARGHTKERVGELAQPLLLDELHVIPNHLRQVIHDLTFREAVMSIGKLLADPQVKATLQRRLGQEKADEFKPWLAGIANYELYNPPGFMRGLDRWAETLRSNGAAAILAGKMTVTLQNFTNLVVALPVIGPEWMGRGFSEAVSDPAGAYRFVAERSAEVRHRAALFDRDARDRLGDLTGRRDPRARAEMLGFALVASTDIATAVPIWLGAYRKALAAGLSERDAVRSGDESVRRTMGSSHPGDLPPVLRKRGPTRLITMFYGYMNQQLNLVSDLFHEAGVGTPGGIRPSAVPQLVGGLLGVWIANTLLGEILSGRLPREGETWAAWAGKRLAFGPFALAPGGSALARALETGELSLTPLEGLFGKVVRAGKEVGEDTATLARGETVEDPADTVLDTLEALGILFGVPGTVQARATGEAIVDAMVEGDTEHTAHDVVYGRQGRKR